jgi:hypothetical protein
MLDVGRLRALLAISEHGGVPAAARALSLSASDVHDQLTALEQSFGVTLVDGDRLTPAGQRVAASGSRPLWPPPDGRTVPSSRFPAFSSPTVTGQVNPVTQQCGPRHARLVAAPAYMESRTSR